MRIYVSGAIAKDPQHKSKFIKAKNLVRANYPTAEVMIPTDISKYMHSRLRPSAYLMKDLELLETWATHIVRIAEDIPSPGADIECAFASYAGIQRLPDLELPK